MNLIFCKPKKAQKQELNFFASLKNLKKHGFDFLQAEKSSKYMNLIFFCIQKI